MRVRPQVGRPAFGVPSMCAVHHTIVTMSRGDGHKIAEWADYHARLGFDDFQVVLDGAVDDTERVLRGLDLPARISVHPRREIGEYYDGLLPEERQHRVQEWRLKHAEQLASGSMRGNDALSWRQHRHFPEVLARYAGGARGRGWLALLDVDEFLVLAAHASIGELTGEATTPRLRFLSFNVDTRGHDPTLPVLEQHSVRWSREDVLAHPMKRWSRRAKSLVRYRCARLTSTVHKISTGRHTVLDPEQSRLHHFKVPVQRQLDIPYTVDDPVHLPMDGAARPRGRALDR